MRLLVDQMWSPVLAEQLRERGHDVVAVAEREDLADKEDAIVFQVGQREQRAVFTEDSGDYVPLAGERLEGGEDVYGLVLTSNDTYPRGHPRTLGRATRALDEYLSARPGTEDLLNGIDWLPSVE